MGWVFLEVVVALLVAVGIVWWTIPRKPGPGARPRDDSEGNGTPRG